MKSRLMLGILATVVALLLIFVQTAPKRSGTSNGSNGTGKQSSSAGGGGSKTAEGDLLGKAGRVETQQERRARMMSNTADHGDLKPSEQDIYLYVQAKGSNAVSLVAAFESTREKDYLKAAAQKFPDDPFVLSKALMWLDMSEDERAKMIEDFKKSSPTNAFANLLAAKEAMKRGDTQKALAELAAGKGKGYNEYFAESTEGLQEAYLAAGHETAEAKTLGMAEITLPHLAPLKEVGRQFVELAEKAAAAGDQKTAQNLLMANWVIGQKLREASDSVPIITQLVGVAIQNATLKNWPAGVPFNGQNIDEVRTATIADTKELKSGAPVFDKWFPTAPDDEIITYMDTTVTAGEREAIRWLKERHPEWANLNPTN
jgi:hypothetical protein